MRLKLFGPDYKDQDPTKALEDFKKRVQAYESAYEPLGKWEEDNDLQYIQVCRDRDLPDCRVSCYSPCFRLSMSARRWSTIVFEVS